MFEFGTFVVSILTFLVLFLIIRRFGFDKFNNILEKRRQFVIDQLNEAEHNRLMAEQHLNEQKQLLEAARHQAHELLETARQRADEQAREIVRTAQDEAQKLLEANRELIERERDEAMNTVLAAVSSLTVDLSEKLLRRHSGDVEHQAMIAEAEAQLGELVC